MEEKEKADMTFEDYYHQYLPLVKKLSYKYKVYGLENEDIEQELLMVLDKCTQNFDDSKGTKFMTYFHSSCYYHIISLRKKNRDYEHPFTPLDINLISRNEMEESVDPVDKAYTSMMFEAIIGIIANLKFSGVAEMYFIGDFTMAEIANFRGVSKSYIGKIVKNMREEVRDELKKLELKR